MKKYILSFLLFICFLLFVPSVAASQKIIQINLSTQTLTALQDGQIIYTFPISSGKIATPTPTGGFWPWIKLTSTRMIGGSKALGTYYNLPNVPYTVYFYNQNFPRYMGYAIHGTYWHNNFGHPMSHGCINVRTSDMLPLFNWIDLPNPSQPGSGTIIMISGVTPAG